MPALVQYSIVEYQQQVKAHVRVLEWTIEKQFLSTFSEDDTSAVTENQTKVKSSDQMPVKGDAWCNG